MGRTSEALLALMTELHLRTFPALVSYPEALTLMEESVQHLIQERGTEAVWFLEHPPLYTVGTSACKEDVIGFSNIPVFQTNRGGRSTYHGPGQRVIYVLLNLKKRKIDIRHFVWSIEEWIIQTLRSFRIEGFRQEGRVGIWVTHPQKGEAKIAALGLRIRSGISFHGISLNVSPDLTHYQGIVPCGISDYPVTSCQDLGFDLSLEDLDNILKQTIESTFFPCLSLPPLPSKRR